MNESFRLEEKILEAVERLQTRLKENEKELSKFKEVDMQKTVEEIKNSSENIGDVNFIYYDVGKNYSKDQVPRLLDFVRKQQSSPDWVTIFKGTDDEGQAYYVAGSSGAISAKKISSALREITGSQGGGNDHMVKGGGGDPSKWSLAEEAVKKWIEEQNR